jgi:hypothetical protein
MCVTRSADPGVNAVAEDVRTQMASLINLVTPDSVRLPHALRPLVSTQLLSPIQRRGACVLQKALRSSNTSYAGVTRQKWLEMPRPRVDNVHLRGRSIGMRRFPNPLRMLNPA